MTGEIPTELGSLANLLDLDLGGNQLTGEIPAELGSLSNLQWLALRNNQLTGAIPVESWRPFQPARICISSENQLTGAIPPELGGLANLSEVIPRRQPVDRVRPRRIARRSEQ